MNSENIIILYDSDHASFTSYQHGADGPLEPVSIPRGHTFLYKNKEVYFHFNRKYQIFFPEKHPTDEYGNTILNISGIIVVGEDDDGALQPYVYEPHIIFERPPVAYRPPGAILLTPWPDMIIFDTQTNEVILSIPETSQ